MSDNPTADRIAKMEAENAELKAQLDRLAIENGRLQRATEYPGLAAVVAQYAKAPVDKGIPMSKYRAVCEERDAALAALAMAQEALKESDRRIWEHHEVGHIERAAKHAWGKPCEICAKETPTIFARNEAALAATAPSVEKYEARLKADGAAEMLLKLGERAEKIVDEAKTPEEAIVGIGALIHTCSVEVVEKDRAAALEARR